MNPWATGLILPTLLNQVETAGKWQVKTGSLSLIDKLVKIAPEPCSKLMPDMVPVLAGAIWDTKADVKKAAKASMTNATALVSNKDIEKCVVGAAAVVAADFYRR
jgi:elongation factor 3